MHPIELSHVWKRYRLGTRHGSLRDTIPALLKGLTGRNGDAPNAEEFWALKDVSFQVNPGETLGIIGPNGAGKSTILKLLSRITKQTTGHVRVHGRLAALIEVGAGFHHDLTGRENIYLNGTILGLRRKEIERLFDSIVAFAELEQFLEMPIKRYSSGMVVRLGFAIAAHVEPEILLVDEVLAVGDLAFQQKCIQRILELKDQRVSMIFISHNLEAVQRICDRVLLLHGGAIVKEGQPSEVVGFYRDEMLRKRRISPHPAMVSHAVGLADGLASLEVSLCGHHGHPQEAFESGDTMQVQVHYVTRRPIRNPSVMVMLQRFDGLLCHEASTRHAGPSWERWEGEGTLSVTYPSLHLGPHQYQVSVAIYEDQNPVPIARLRHTAAFRVTNKRQARGMVALDYVWGDAVSPSPTKGAS